MEKYDPTAIEKKWQGVWEKWGIYRAKDKDKKKKFYVLVEFPYPSGDGLHVGHARSYSALDVVARKKRMEGLNVLFPFGWDAFGLPTENYALKTGIHPQVATEQNITNFKKQAQSLGLSFDWSREIKTTDPNYYKWTQWIFLKLFKKGLAYQAEIPINWCPSCQIGLANEEVVSGRCERCGMAVGKKVRKQWMLKITAYADRLIEDLTKVDYPLKVKLAQINWIGRSEGARIEFKVQSSKFKVEVFTTRPDTLFGATALVLAPEHPLVPKINTSQYKQSVSQYIEETLKKSELERVEAGKIKTGVFTGAYGVNPANQEKIPIWIADYILTSYGTGAIMLVPAHDQRDFEFAKKYDLEIREVITPDGDGSCRSSAPSVSHSANKPGAPAWGSPTRVTRRVEIREAYLGEGVIINSGQFDGLSSKEAAKKITEWLIVNKRGKKAVNYKLRDWVFSRQHYWGEPIPIIHCPKCGAVAVPEENLPVELPYVEKYQPTGTGESPLAMVKDWVNVACPKCSEAARRETDTMPNWAGSSWYFMRYCDPQNDKTLANPQKLKYWLPVDWYNGGFEHTTLHLLYSRFWYKFLYDIGAAPTDEPYGRRTSHGVVLAQDGRKMSKSLGNVIRPEEMIKRYGADTLRLYEMFIGPFDQAVFWNTRGLLGVNRFLEKVWRLSLTCNKNQKTTPEVWRVLYRLNKKINEDLETTKFNTAVAAFMEFVNFAWERKNDVGQEAIKTLLLLLAPFAPYITEELWFRTQSDSALRSPTNDFFGFHSLREGAIPVSRSLRRSQGKRSKIGRAPRADKSWSIHQQSWPQYDPKMIEEEMMTVMVEVNGRVRDKFKVQSAKCKVQKEVENMAREKEKVKRFLAGKEVKKVIFVPGKIINFVTG